MSVMHSTFPDVEGLVTEETQALTQDGTPYTLITFQFPNGQIYNLAKEVRYYGCKPIRGQQTCPHGYNFLSHGFGCCCVFCNMDGARIQRETLPARRSARLEYLWGPYAERASLTSPTEEFMDTGRPMSWTNKEDLPDENF